MTTKLEGPLKREIEIDGTPYVLTLRVDGFSLVPKGKRKGFDMAWSAFVSGEAALAQALNASLAAAPTAPARAQTSDGALPIAKGTRPARNRS